MKKKRRMELFWGFKFSRPPAGVVSILRQFLDEYFFGILETIYCSPFFNIITVNGVYQGDLLGPLVPFLTNVLSILS